MGTLYSHPGYNKYDLFGQAADITITDNKNPIAIPANLISNDKDNEESDISPQIGPPSILIPKGNHPNQGTTSKQIPEDMEAELKGVNPCELHLSPEQKGITKSKLPAVIEDDNISVVVDEEDRLKNTPEAELLMAHHQFQHISFSKLQEMARQGILPRRLAQCKIPSYSACLYGKATKSKKWPVKGYYLGD